MPSPRWHEISAVLGGSFDPPHLGHLRAAEGLLVDPGVARLRILPSFYSLTKSPQASPEDRLELVRQGFAPLLAKGVATLDDREVRRGQARPGHPTYTYETLSELQQEHGGHWAFVLGTDQLAALDRWHRFPELLEQCHWIILERKGEPKDLAQKRLNEWVASGLIRPSRTREWTTVTQKKTLIWTYTDAPSISSTMIRESLAISGTAPAGSLLPEVEASLKRLGLYGMKPSQ